MQRTSGKTLLLATLRPRVDPSVVCKIVKRSLNFRIHAAKLVRFFLETAPHREPVYYLTKRTALLVISAFFAGFFGVADGCSTLHIDRI